MRKLSQYEHFKGVWTIRRQLEFVKLGADRVSRGCEIIVGNGAEGGFKKKGYALEMRSTKWLGCMTFLRLCSHGLKRGEGDKTVTEEKTPDSVHGLDAMTP